MCPALSCDLGQTNTVLIAKGLPLGSRREGERTCSMGFPSRLQWEPWGRRDRATAAPGLRAVSTWGEGDMSFSRASRWCSHDLHLSRERLNTTVVGAGDRDD